MSDITSFVSFLTEVLKTNTDTSNQNAIVHAATRDTLQRVCDQLPQLVEAFIAKKEGIDETATTDSTSVVPVEA